jgi:hypothetical protein
MRTLSDGLPSLCDSQRVTFDLGSFSVGVEAKAATWTALGVRWQLKPVSPNYGKPVVTGVFESARWIGDMTVWITGEAELVTVRLAGCTSMHHLLVVSTPIREPPYDVIVVRAPGSLHPPRQGQVLIGHLSCTGRNDCIERPAGDAVRLFWRFVIEKYGVHPVRPPA